ncbi:MAG: hypothetical protein Q8R39_03230 [bacterium]|nr:hypothetical protein [bacterium]MDZ4285080.1 hypothetical protein [Patescibacteria group bacterium]
MNSFGRFILAFVVISVAAHAVSLFVSAETVFQYETEYQYDTEYASKDSGVRVLVPKYWSVSERTFTTLSNNSVGLISLRDRTDQGVRIVKKAYVLSSTPAAIFSVPEAVVAKVDPIDLVNFYIAQQRRSLVGVRVTAASMKERDGNKIYSVEWSYVSTKKNRLIVFDDFIFRKGKVHQVHTVYTDKNPVLRDLMVRILQSVKFTNY